MAKMLFAGGPVDPFAHLHHFVPGVEDVFEVGWFSADLAVVPGVYPMESWVFLPVFERNGEIHGGYYTPDSRQLIAFVEVFSFAGATI